MASLDSKRNNVVMTGGNFSISCLIFSSPRVITAYDELPLWSAMFGLLLLEEVPITGGKFALDVGWAPDFRLLSSPSDSDHPHQQEGPSSHQKYCGKGCSRGSEMKENRTTGFRTS